MQSGREYILRLSGLLRESDGDTINPTNPTVDGRRIDPDQMHMDFYHWLQIQDRTSMDLARFFDEMKTTSSMQSFLKQYSSPVNWENGRFKPTMGMGRQQHIV